MKIFLAIYTIALLSLTGCEDVLGEKQYPLKTETTNLNKKDMTANSVSEKGPFSDISTMVQTSPDDVWNELSGQALKDYQANNPGQTIRVEPEKGRIYTLNEKAIKNIFKKAPLERIELPLEEQPTPVQITLPNPDGNYVVFEIVESPVMAPELAAKFPEIKTYSGYSISSHQVSVQIDYSPKGFHAQVLNYADTWYIDPYYGNKTYISYYKRNYKPKDKYFKCLTEGKGNINR